MHAWYIFQMKDEAQIGGNLFFPFIALQLNWHEWTELKNSISRKLLKRFLNKLCESQWVQKKKIATDSDEEFRIQSKMISLWQQSRSKTKF